MLLHGGANPAYHHYHDPSYPDAHRYVLATLNIESLNTQLEQLQIYGYHDDIGPPDLIVLCEHRVAEKQLNAATQKLRDNGWTAHFATAPMQNGKAHGGVAICTRSGLQFKPHTDGLQRWNQQGRLLHGSVLTPSGLHLCDLAAAYGYSDYKMHKDDMNAFIDDLEAWIAPRHTLPLILAGDLNFNVKDQPTVAHWINCGLMHDLVGLFETPRCSTHVSGSCLDHLLGSTAMRSMCQRAATQPQFTCPTHRGLSMIIGKAPQRTTGYLHAHAIPLTRLGRLYLERQPRAQQADPDFLNDLKYGNVDGAHAKWCAKWEQLLLQACEAEGTVTTTQHEGRAAVTTTCHIPPVPRAASRQHLPLPVRQLLHTVNSLRALLYRELREPPPTTWQELHQYHRRRQQLKARLAKIHDYQFDIRDQYGVERALDVLQPRLQALRQQHAKEALCQWKMRMSDYAMACRHVTQQPIARLDRLLQEDGTWTTNIEHMDKELISIWSQQAIQDPDSLDTVREQVRQLAQDLVPEQPYADIEPLTYKDIMDSITTTRRAAAPGPGCWHPGDLKNLPRQAVRELTSLYQTCEKWQHFPTLFAESVTTNIPKGPNKFKASEQRPITVFPMLWRVYAKARARQITHSLANHLSPCQRGAIPGCSVEDLVLEIKLHTDGMIKNHGELHGLQIDIMKCFNGLDHDLALYVLQRMGLPPTLAQLWNAQYLRHQTRHRFPGGLVGEPYAPPRGIAQGDPLAVLMANAVLSLLPKSLEAYCQRDDAHPVDQWWFLDDSTIITKRQEDLVNAYQVLKTTFDTMALRISLPKTVYFTNMPDQYLCIDNQRLPGVQQLELLGADFKIPSEPCHQHPPQPQLQARNRQRWAKVQPRIRLLQPLPLSIRQKTQLATACITALWRYVPIGTWPHQQQLLGTQNVLQQAILGKLHREAAPEIVYGQLLPVHFMHIPFAKAYALLRLLRRAWIRGFFRPDMIEQTTVQDTFIDNVRSPLQTAGLGLKDHHLYTDNVDTKLHLFATTPQKQWLHDLRELFRDHLLARLAKRRPREFSSVSQGIVRELSLTTWRKATDPKVVMGLKKWLTGSVPFRERIWRHCTTGSATSPYCVWCYYAHNDLKEETMEHIISHCSFHAECRHQPHWRLAAQVPEIWLLTGLLPRGHSLEPGAAKLWPRLQTAIAELLVTRDHKLHEIEKDYGSPPPKARPSTTVRRRLVGKQPPTASCPRHHHGNKGQPPIMLAEERPEENGISTTTVLWHYHLLHKL